jgi:hypothetical protein
MHLIELIEVQREDGPCLDCWRTGEAVREDELAKSRVRWPRFAPAALEAGFLSAYAVPMRLRDERLGALNLFSNQTYGLIEPDEAIAQAMADVATIGILHERFIRQREEVSQQLRAAFNARIALEQAKGIVAEATGTDMDEAFALMRAYTGRRRILLSEVASQVISRELEVDALRSRLTPLVAPRAEGGTTFRHFLWERAVPGLPYPYSHPPRSLAIDQGTPEGRCGQWFEAHLVEDLRTSEGPCLRSSESPRREKVLERWPDSIMFPDCETCGRC